jgi:hypothetical protein
MTTLLSEAEEKQLQREAQIENLKGPKGPGENHDIHGNYVPLPPAEAELKWREEQAKRQEAAKRSTPPPPRAEIDFLEQRRRQLIEQRRAERIKAATGGRLE